MPKPNKHKAVNAGGFTGGAAAALPLIGFLAFGLIPLALALVVAFTELHSTDISLAEFVGFDNFLYILKGGEGYTWPSYLSTIIFLLNIPLCMGLSIWVSLLINRSRWGKKFFRSVFFIPYVCSSVVVTLAFRTLLLNVDSGVLNDILLRLGFKPVGWLVTTPMLFMVCAILISVWRGLGWCIVLYQAALANVDDTYYEAAAIDGASPWQSFWRITWPAVSPTTAYMVVMKFISSMQETEMMMMLTRGGSGNSSVPMWPFSSAWVSDTVTKHIYNMIFESPYRWGYGTAAAAGWILAIFILIATRVMMKAQEKWVCYDF